MAAGSHHWLDHQHCPYPTCHIYGLLLFFEKQIKANKMKFHADISNTSNVRHTSPSIHDERPNVLLCIDKYPILIYDTTSLCRLQHRYLIWHQVAETLAALYSPCIWAGVFPRLSWHCIGFIEYNATSSISIYIILFLSFLTLLSFISYVFAQLKAGAALVLEISLIPQLNSLVFSQEELLLRKDS